MRLRLAAALLLAGCMSDEQARRDVARLSRQLEELRRQTDGDRHAVHELENRMFVVEDKVDTVQVAHGKTPDVAPRLPVVTKAPEPPAAETPASEPMAPVEEPSDAPPVVIKLDGRAQHRSSPSVDLATVDEKLPVVPLSKQPVAAVPAPQEDAMAAYQKAYQALGRRDHQAAIAGFREFIRRWPAHDYADNAQYWLGETYYDLADYQTALVEFRAVIKRYPTGNKAPDALLKVGFCLAKLGNASGAGDVLAQVVEIYPKTEAARLATRRLEEMRR